MALQRRSGKALLWMYWPTCLIGSIICSFQRPKQPCGSNVRLAWLTLLAPPRLVGTPPETRRSKQQSRATQSMASIPEAIYCSAPEIRCGFASQACIDSNSVSCVQSLGLDTRSGAGPAVPYRIFLCRVSFEALGANEATPKAAARRRSNSNPERSLVFEVAAKAGSLTRPAPVTAPNTACTGGIKASSTPDPMSPPRYDEQKCTSLSHASYLS